MPNSEPVGVVTRVQRFPVKSMACDPLQAVELGWNGLAGDRQYAFVRSNNRGRFPYLTAREVPDMLLYRARYLTPEDPRKSAVAVTSPSGMEYDIEDPVLCRELGEAAGEPVHLMQLGRGHFDTAVVSIVATTTTGRLAHAHGSDIDLQRFRINLIVEPLHPEAWDRDWLGRSLAVADGAARLRVDMPIERCAMITLDPTTAQRDVTVMKTVAKKFGNEIGMYCTVEQPGVIRPGDAIHLRG
jgi:uncharacterized protein